ncbi:MAG: nickel-dependent lactate racemase [Gemmatimonadales bacterium]
MRIDFPYPGYEAIAPVEVPDANLMGVFAPETVSGVDEDATLREGLAHPIEAAPLRETVTSGDRVLILIDDATRATPTAKVLPAVIDELHSAGVPDARIELLQAPGTHRPMTDQEVRAKLGRCYGRYRVHEHHYLDRTTLHHYGTTRDGTPVTANRLLREFDFVLGVGSIVPHRVKGFSGGAKIAFPGVSGSEMMERNQWEASMHMSVTVMGVPENPMRLRREEAAKLAGLRYIVNVVYDVERRVAGCFAGDVVAAHRAGCRRAREVYGVHLPTRADIVLIDSHSADRDFWQSAKGAYAGDVAVKTGGSLILVAPNPEGVASNHANVLEIGYRPHGELVRLVQQGGVKDLVGLAILADVAQIVDRADCIMVSPGVTAEEAARLGFRSARSPSEALAMALERQGPQATIAVLRYGGHVLPIVDDETAQLSAAGDGAGEASWQQR